MVGCTGSPVHTGVIQTEDVTEEPHMYTLQKAFHLKVLLL